MHVSVHSSYSKYCRQMCSFYPLFVGFSKNVLFVFERVQAGEGRREGDRESTPPSNSGLCVDSSEPDVGLELTNLEIMT